MTRRRRKNKLTETEHRAAGLQLQAVYLNLLHLETMYMKRYGHTDPFVKTITTARSAAMRAKVAADDRFFMENPFAQDALYYPGQNIEAQRPGGNQNVFQPKKGNARN